jgi:hypothetical protein
LAHVEGRHLALAAAGCAGLAVLAFVDPNATRLGPPCPLRSMTGLDCPLCGATRATHALVHGRLGEALDFNVLYVIALPVLAVVTLYWLASGRLPAPLRRPSATWVALGIGVVFMVVRNLPAFTVLGA